MAVQCRYVSAAYVRAFERGRRDGYCGVGYTSMRDWAEKRCHRSAYGEGFALGVTEEVLSRPAGSQSRAFMTGP